MYTWIEVQHKCTDGLQGHQGPAIIGTRALDFLHKILTEDEEEDERKTTTYTVYSYLLPRFPDPNFLVLKYIKQFILSLVPVLMPTLY